ncbi:MAG: 1-acyl-sn-glycerol-3-phosphate acyltransferase [Methylophaga sp.]|nr:MAG: 1-acyl-sn-glycerol-3-phosphate acyltransferase [Methylophaga sp.]
MWNRIDYGWRWFATAFSFFMFGLGGILVPIVVIPILYLLPGSTVQKQQRGQRFIHYAFRTFIGMMASLGVLTYEVKHRTKLQDAKLVLANHPTLLDIVFLISIIPNASCIVKSALVRNPFTWGPIKLAGYIINDDDADNVLALAKTAFNKNHALVVFPEGSRTTPHQQTTLKRGAANIAIRTQVDISPVLIQCTPLTLTKMHRWYQIPKKRMHFYIEIKDKIMISPYLESKTPSKGARQLTRDLSQYFNQEIELRE